MPYRHGLIILRLYIVSPQYQILIWRTITECWGQQHQREQAQLTKAALTSKRASTVNRLQSTRNLQNSGLVGPTGLARAEIFAEISAPPTSLTNLTMTEYTDCTLSVERWDSERKNCRPSAPYVPRLKNMKSLTLHTHGCLKASLRDYLFL